MQLQIVMRGLVPRTHVFLMVENKTWVAGTSPAMTIEGCIQDSSNTFCAQENLNRTAVALGRASTTFLFYDNSWMAGLIPGMNPGTAMTRKWSLNNSAKNRAGSLRRGFFQRCRAY